MRPKRDNFRRRGGPMPLASRNQLGMLIEQRLADRFSYAHSISQLEAITGISREAIRRYVSVRSEVFRSPPIEAIAALAEALQVSPCMILEAAI